MPVNKENIRKWIKALRSGKYRQGTGTLKTNDSNKHAYYCCLGLACKVAKENVFVLT